MLPEQARGSESRGRLSHVDIRGSQLRVSIYAAGAPVSASLGGVYGVVWRWDGNLGLDWGVVCSSESPYPPPLNHLQILGRTMVICQHLARVARTGHTD